MVISLIYKLKYLEMVLAKIISVHIANVVYSGAALNR